MISDACTVARCFEFMATGAGSIAATNVIFPTVSKLVSVMRKEDFRKEKLYQTTMHIARKMLSDGIISLEEYRAADKIFLEKYRPILGTLFSDMALTSRSVSVIYGEGDTNAKDYTYNADRGGSEGKKTSGGLCPCFDGNGQTQPFLVGTDQLL